MQNKKLYWIIGTLITLLLTVVIYKKATTNNGIQVAVETVTKHTIVETVSSSGKIYPVNEVKISPDASGEITNLYVQEGQFVTKGQLLCIIKSSAMPSFPSMLSGMPVKETPEYKYVKIYSPIAGEVNSLTVKQGERVVGTMQMAGTDIMRISDMSRLKVDIEVGENDIQKVKKGDSVNIKVDAYNNQEFKGLVLKIAQNNVGGGAFAQQMGAMNDQATSYKVSIAMLPESYMQVVETNQSKAPFRVGMSATVSILTKQHIQVIAVPINAVTTREEDDSVTSKTTDDKVNEYVFLVDKNNKAKQVLVTTLIQDNKVIEIAKGLSGGEQIIVAPYAAIARTLKDKKEIQVVDKKKLFDKEEE
jgi:multidrug efflux pump subunit AcrA (membrane-fusion protein)